MGDLCNIRAPQWIDLTQNYSPVQTHDFFEREHTMHECTEEPNSTTGNADVQPTSQVEVSCINEKAQADLDIIKNTPVKVISPKYGNNKETVVAEATYDQVLNDAMRKLELYTKQPKTRDVLNKTTQEPKIFKTPNFQPKLIKSSRSIGCILNKNNQFEQDSIGGSAKINKTSSNCTSTNTKKKLVKQSLFKQDKDCAKNDIFKKPNHPVDYPKAKEDKQCNKEDNKESKEDKQCNEEYNEESKEDNNEEHNEKDDKSQDEQESTNEKNNKARDNQDDVDAKDNHTQSKHVAVLTWQNHRRSVHRRRTSINKPYVGLAEAVSRFQNDTPKRFRTRSNKNNTMSPSFYVSKLQNRLKPTIPVSPALISKTRTRPVTVLNQEERELQEIEEMRKFRIKANPIPSNVLRGPRAVNVARKQTVANTATQSEEKTKSLYESKSPHRDKASSLKNTVTKVVVTDSEGIIVEHEEIAFFGVPKSTGATKSVTRVVPFSFETRNKDMQLKKEQRLKDLQEASKIKAEFHARPVPNFSKPSTSTSMKPPTPTSTKPPTPLVKQQQNAKRQLLPRPFSFEERNKKLSQRKDQLVKQVLEEDKRSRVFRANPAPVFKPVMVRGRSKDNLSLKNKSVKTGSEHGAEYKCEDQENKEPNETDSCKAEGENTQRTASSNVDKQKVPLKALPVELNTDRRAKQRRNFDEQLKRKEEEEEMKRQKEDKKRLEQDKHLKAELRKQAEIKAKPMPKYKPPVIARATKPLTNPQSPAFASKLKSKLDKKA
ncbi:targeting protein for Xklp2 [Nylanderia fulva]|uniref:targeting protein for Xklp2 n=1 Tax=Nylanderia fulva TaxID=613905 RepID=UPI0010FBBDF8|nr:targeting protein for Xklp2 [Nylanderia fulva]